MARKKKPPRRYIRAPSDADAPFIDAILAAPDDDTPRLVYADHLLEHGDAVHGELITVQCTRARLEREDATTTPAYRTARIRERELLAVFDDAWLRTFSAHGFRGEWDRGFLARISGSAVIGLRERWPLLSRHPIHEIATSDARGAGHYPPLSDLRWLVADAPALRTLGISGWQGAAELVPAGVTEASDLPSWAQNAPLPDETLLPFVSALRFSHPRFMPLAEAARAPLPRLRRLTITSPADTASLRELIAAPVFAELEHLECWSLTVPHGLAVLERAPRTLRTLTLTCEYPWRFDDMIGQRLAECAALESLEELRVAVECDAPLTEALSERAPKLERLVLSQGLTRSAVEAIARQPLAGRLGLLELGGPAGVHVTGSDLARIPFRRLTTLALQAMRLDHDFATAPALDTLAELKLDGCVMEPAVKEAILARWPYARIA